MVLFSGIKVRAEVVTWRITFTFSRLSEIMQIAVREDLNSRAILSVALSIMSSKSKEPCWQ